MAIASDDYRIGAIDTCNIIMQHIAAVTSVGVKLTPEILTQIITAQRDMY